MKVKLISINQEKIHYPVKPIGMCLVGEATRKSGHHVEMHDMMFQRKRDCLPQWLGKPHDVVGISMRN